MKGEGTARGCCNGREVGMGMILHIILQCMFSYVGLRLHFALAYCTCFTLSQMCTCTWRMQVRTPACHP